MDSRLLGTIDQIGIEWKSNSHALTHRLILGACLTCIRDLSEWIWLATT